MASWGLGGFVMIFSAHWWWRGRGETCQRCLRDLNNGDVPQGFLLHFVWTSGALPSCWRGVELLS